MVWLESQTGPALEPRGPLMEKFFMSHTLKHNPSHAGGTIRSRTIATAKRP
jgi:hypothetical protein